MFMPQQIIKLECKIYVESKFYFVICLIFMEKLITTRKLLNKY